MTVSDPIADFIIQIKNAGQSGKDSVVVPYSKLKMAVAELLNKEGYVASVEKHGRKTKKFIEIGILYTDSKEPRIQDVRKISKPSRRVYVSTQDIRSVRQGHGISVLSTPQGVLTGEEAKKRGVGGESLFDIW